MTDESGTFLVCKRKHFWMIQKVSQKDEGQTPSFYRMCRHCGALEIRRVVLIKQPNGDVKTKVRVFLNLVGNTNPLPSRTYRLIDEDDDLHKEHEQGEPQ